MHWNVEQRGVVVRNDFDERMTAEPLVAEVLAFRSFRIDPLTQTLGGLSYHQEIASGVNVAQCAYDEEEDHAAPSEGCSCGWYAYDEMRRWGGLGKTTQPVKPIPLTATGIVRLSGKVIVCERGLKAENMEIVALTVHPSNEALIRQKFPNAQVFLDEGLMLEAFPLTRLSRGDEEEEGMGGEKRFHVSGIDVTPVAKALRAGASHAKNAWTSLAQKATLWEILRWVFARALILAFWVAILWLLRDVCRALFPAGSVGGFGPFVPLGVMVLLSPLLSVWKSKGGLVVYLFLVIYGVANTGEAVDALVAQTDVERYQIETVFGALIAAPAILLMGHLAQATLRAGRPSSSGPVLVAASGPAGGSAAGGVSGRLSFVPNNRLPKKVKSTHTEGGDAAPGTEQEGGQHG